MKRKQCEKLEDGSVRMTMGNVKICLSNQQEAYQTLELNEALHLQYYGFSNIDNLQFFPKVHSLYLNNNLIEKVAGLDTLSNLCTLNLSHNRICTLEGLAQLSVLYTLDIAHNQLKELPSEELKPLKMLHTLKAGSNRFANYADIAGVAAVAASLSYLDLSNNEQLAYQETIYAELFGQLQLTVLSLQGCPLVRAVPNYRKQTILALQQLLFLDDRPVTSDERKLAEAWKTGGLPLEREVRAQIRENTIQKHSKIYQQMEERNQIVEEKRRQVLQKKTQSERHTLSTLLAEKQSEDYQLLDQQARYLLDIRIEELQKYIELMSAAVLTMDLEKELSDGKVKLPTMLIDRETPEAVYVYNVAQEQLPLIIQHYYPHQTRPVLIGNPPPQAASWNSDYDQLLHATYDQARGNFPLLLPLFNLGVYELNAETGRALKRFQEGELKERLVGLRAEEDRRQKSIEALYELD